MFLRAQDIFGNFISIMFYSWVKRVIQRFNDVIRVAETASDVRVSERLNAWGFTPYLTIFQSFDAK